MGVAMLPARILDLVVEIQQIPSPTFQETQRAEFVCRKFRAEGLSDIRIDSIGNVYGRLPGKSSARPLVLSAHLDSVFPMDTDLQVSRTADQVTGPGIGDNALGVAGLFGLLWLLKDQEQLNGDAWFVANVGEEGLGDLRGMQAVVDRFQDRPKAYLVLEGMALGSVYYRGLRVQRYRITAHTCGGHSWVNFGRPSAIHELARLVTRLQEIALPGPPRTTYNVGIIQGGTSVNTIASQAMLELDLRSENEAILDDLARQVLELANSASRAAGKSGDDYVDFQVTRIGDRPMGELPPDHPLPRLASRALEKLGITPKMEIGSTDANVPLSRGYPAICIGLTTGRGAHTQNETIDTAPLEQGLAQLLEVVSGIDRMPG